MKPIAAFGGSPVRTQPIAPWPHFAQDEIDAAARVLSSGKVNYWTGSECSLFEEEFAAAVGVRYAISLANGTVALELALLALDIGPGDEVIVPSRTFIATASCVVARGARPIVADVDPVSGNLNASAVESVITSRTRAIIPVHLAGWPCAMDEILGLAEARGLKVIEDCAQAHGAMFKGRSVGSFGHCAAFSFCQDKIMTTGGEGGMLLTNDEAVWRRAWEYKDHGKSLDAVRRKDHPPGFRWLHESFGSNYRLTEMQAAIGRRQLDKLPDWVRQRRENAEFLAERFRQIDGLRLALPGPDVFHSYYKFYAFLELDRLKADWSQGRIVDSIVAEGVPCMTGSCSEIYREKAFVSSGFAPSAPMPVAANFGRTSLMFLVHPTLERRDLEDTAAATEKVLREAVL